MMAYLIDTSVFIQAKKLYYGFDFCPAFWDWLVEKNAAGVVFSIEQVENEIAAGTDDLSTWSGARGSGFFLRPDENVVAAFRPLSEWATVNRAYDAAAVTTFMRVADSFLIAHALAHGHVVVTNEIVKNSRKTIQIPEACIGVGVTCMTLFQMLRKEGALFVLGKRK